MSTVLHWALDPSPPHAARAEGRTVWRASSQPLAAALGDSGAAAIGT